MDTTPRRNPIRGHGNPTRRREEVQSVLNRGKIVALQNITYRVAMTNAKLDRKGII